MDWLFGQIHGLFGNPFLDKFRSGHIVNGKDTGIENMKAVWADKIRSNRMHFGEIKRGIAGCQRLKFPPSWSEFFDLCRPALNVDHAIYEAVQQLELRKEGKDEWSHPAIYWAAVKFGHYEMTTLTHSAIKPRFTLLLQEMLAKPDLEPVPPRMDALPAPGNSQTTREAALATLSKLKADGLIQKFTKGTAVKRDPRQWARKILEREKAGDPTLTELQVRFAREALSAPEYAD